MRVAIDRRVGDPAYRVVPVLLPGAHRGKRSAVPPFPANVTWVEFQRSLDEEQPFHRLVAGIEGNPRGARQGHVAGANPYRGLKAFDVADNALYFGRESLTGWLLSDIRSCLANRGEMRLLAVVGASGSGKSSLARAGLLAELECRRARRQRVLAQIVLKPGADPLESLAMRRRGRASHLAADQAAVLKFQDDLGADPRMLHTQAALALAARPQARAWSCWWTSSRRSSRSATVKNVGARSSTTSCIPLPSPTARRSSCSRCGPISLASARPMTPRRGALRSARNSWGRCGARNCARPSSGRPGRPAASSSRGWWTCCLDDVEAQPGGLPLLQHALFELWRQREGRRFSHAAYEHIGRVKGALARRADEVYRGFSRRSRR